MLNARARGQPTTYEQALAALQEAERLDPHRPDVLLQMGSVYAGMGDVTKATEAMQQAQALDPTSPGPYIAIAKMQLGQGNNKGAIQTLTALISHSPRHYEAYKQVYDIYLQDNDTAHANAALESALAVAPQTAQDHLWRGKFLRFLGRNEQAASEFRIAGQDPALWEAHLALGQILQESGRGPEALDEYQSVLAAQPDDPTALLNTGKLLALAGQQADAEKTLAHLLQIAPGSVDGHVTYVELLLSKGQFDKAVAEGLRAVQSDSKRADAHFYLGLAYEARKDWPNASAQFKATVERDPAHFEALVRLAAALFRDDRYAEAIDAADAATRLRDTDPQAYRWRAEAQIALRDPDGALASLGRALKLSPQFADAMALTARAYLLKADARSALAYANKASEADSRNPAGKLAAGEAYLATRQPNEALDAFSAALALVPGSAEVVTGQGRAYDALGDKERALKLYRDAASLDKEYADAHLYSGHAYVEMDRWDDALREYSKAAQLRPRWPEGLYYLGRAYMQRKDLQKAQKTFASATKYSPNLVEAWFGLGIANRDLGLHDEAISALSKATALNANYTDAWLYLGLTYEEAGDRTEAAQAFQRARDASTDPAIRQQAAQGLQRTR